MLMQIHSKTMRIFTACLLGGFIGSCKKLVEIPPPIDTITTTQVFNSDRQAEAAMVGVYGKMINGATTNNGLVWQQVYSGGLSTILGGLSSDELFNYKGASEMNYYSFTSNKLTIFNSGQADYAWASAYTTVYGANSVIEGIAASTSSQLSDSARKVLTGEAKFARAFAYFMLTNFYGDVPLALTVDFNQTIRLPRAPQEAVYRQIIQDLKDAQLSLPAVYTGNGERIRPNKWAATALLARAYLYTKDYAAAATESTKIIDNNSLYGLETDLNNVFLVNGREAIWQLQQSTQFSNVKNATPEGYNMIPLNNINAASAPFCLTSHLLSAFETGDQRFTAWVGKTDNSSTGPSTGITYYPYKYKVGNHNSVQGAPATEYYMVLRLAEQYLIRAEATANGAQGGIAAAIADLNIIRNRAALPDLPTSLTAEQTLAAIAKERQVELFAEWGHRWMDLKRTGKANDLLSAIPIKQPWLGSNQLLYPIPQGDLRSDPFLIQNPGY